MQKQTPTWKRRVTAARRKVRELAVVGHALASTRHVVMAQIVPMRFCNLSCAYCNEYDKVSKPVPLEEMVRRIDHLAALGSSIITISGGEPLTHPELDGIIARIRRHGRVAGMITNGYLLMPERIERLNRAGLDHMQISIDNIEPDEISKKSLKVLDKKLEFLSRMPSSTSISTPWLAEASRIPRTRWSSANGRWSWGLLRPSASSTMGKVN